MNRSYLSSGLGSRGAINQAGYAYVGSHSEQNRSRSIGGADVAYFVGGDEKSRSFFAMQNDAHWPIASFCGSATNGRFWAHSDRTDLQGNCTWRVALAARNRPSFRTRRNPLRRKPPEEWAKIFNVIPFPQVSDWQGSALRRCGEILFGNWKAKCGRRRKDWLTAVSPAADRSLGMQIQVLNSINGLEINEALVTLRRERRTRSLSAPILSIDGAPTQLAILAARQGIP